MSAIRDDFTGDLDHHWKRYEGGRGRLELTGSALRFVINDVTRDAYANAQIDDYQGLARRRFLWRPPLQLTVRARFSHPAARGPVGSASNTAGSPAVGLQGTAGFGFWNDPFLMTGTRAPTLPRALWFFYASPPSDMKLDLRTPGYGWKAATIDALRPVTLPLAPFAPLVVPLMNLRPLYRVLWPPIQRALAVREALVETDLTKWHTYVLEWETKQAHFYVDQQAILLNAPSPRGPLGFVMWMDSQYMIVTPQGRLGWGLLDVPHRQWMEVDRLVIEPTQPR